MPIDIWNLTNADKNDLLSSVEHLCKVKELSEHFVENTVIKTSKTTNIDIWNLTISDSKPPCNTSLDVLDSRLAKKRLNDHSDILFSDPITEDIAGGNSLLVASSLAASKEISLGTVADPFKPAFTVLIQEHAAQERTIKERLWWIAWVLGFGADKRQMEKVLFYWAEYGANAKDRKQPYLDEGIPMLPYTVEPKYRYWEGGQPLLDTLFELGASDKVIDDRVTKERRPSDWQRWLNIKAVRRK